MLFVIHYSNGQLKITELEELFSCIHIISMKEVDNRSVEEMKLMKPCFICEAHVLSTVNSVLPRSKDFFLIHHSHTSLSRIVDADHQRHIIVGSHGEFHIIMLVR